MKGLREMNFTKMHGNGNDFILIEDLDNIIKDDSSLARTLCHRNFSIGADGILLVRTSNIADIKMVIINSDGSIASMCGNGIRCFAKYIWEKGIIKANSIKIETGDGIKIADLKIIQNEVAEVTINMGKALFNPTYIKSTSSLEIIDKKVIINNRQYNITSLFMGVPHTIIFGELDDYKVEEGLYIEKYHLFAQGTNVNFCEIINKNKILVKTWERGAGATLACGTGSCAAVVAGNKLGLLERFVRVEVPGGILDVELTDFGVMMTGPAVVSFNGECKI
jgi:diaminopimelate epimerase